MKLRVRLIGIEKPHHGIRTICCGTFLGAHDLRHIIPNKKQLEKLFPRNSGIHFDSISKNQIVIQPDKYINASLNGQEMVAGEGYLIDHGDAKILSIGEVQLRMQTLQSYF